MLVEDNQSQVSVWVSITIIHVVGESHIAENAIEDFFAILATSYSPNIRTT